MKDLYPEYIQNSQNSVRRQSSQFLEREND